MHVKRFHRPTVREALAAARAELGPNALVLSTELVAAGGWRGLVGQRVVCLTAANERPMSEERPSPSPRRPAVAGDLRSGAVARLTATGLDADLAGAIAARLSPADCRGESLAAVRRALTAELATLASDDQEFARYEVFVGPPGMGKTTTIAKIVARERVRGGTPLGMVAADAFRAGAIEHLRSYASVIGAPFRVARSAAELDQALTSTRHAVLVDTAGRSPADDGLSELLCVLERKRGVRTHLVIAADTSAATARRIFDRYATARPSRVVITKVDECESVAPLLGVVRDSGLPVSYLATGQRVPDDLERATPAWLAAALLREPAQEVQACH